jgi:hypothetical protein
VLRKSEGLRIRTRGLSMHPWLKYIFPFHRTYAGVVTTGCAALRNLRLGVFFAVYCGVHCISSHRMRGQFHFLNTLSPTEQ